MTGVQTCALPIYLVLHRLIENEIARMLADELLFGRLAKGGKVIVDLAEGKLTFAYSETQAPAPTPVEP